MLGVVEISPVVEVWGSTVEVEDEIPGIAVEVTLLAMWDDVVALTLIVVVVVVVVVVV